MSSSVFEARARLAKALANPARLQMLDALAKVNELCVCELVALVGLDQTTISKHLAVLKNVGIVDSRKQGLQVYYQLKTPCIMSFFTCVDRMLHADEQVCATCTENVAAGICTRNE